MELKDLDVLYDFCSENWNVSVMGIIAISQVKQNESIIIIEKVCLGLGIKEEEFDYFMDYEIMMISHFKYEGT